VTGAPTLHDRGWPAVGDDHVGIPHELLKLSMSEVRPRSGHRWRV